MKTLTSLAIVLITPLPLAARTTIFRLGICCQNEAGTIGCDDRPCNRDTDCAAGLLCAGESAADADATASGPLYPPGEPICTTASPIFTLMKSYHEDPDAGVSGLYDVQTAIVNFDTSSLPDRDNVTKAALVFWITRRVATDRYFELTGEWWPMATGCLETYSADCGSNAFTADLWRISPGAINTMVLEQPDAFISRTGPPILRICSRDAAPIGVNEVIIPTFDDVTHGGPALMVEHGPR